MRKRKIIAVLAVICCAVAGILFYLTRTEEDPFEGCEVSEGPYISGTAADENHVYHGIQSLFVNLKPNAEELGESRKESIVILRSEEGLCMEANFKKLEDDKCELTYEYYTEDTKDEKELSFRLINYYPEGFVIIDDKGERYTYNQTVQREGQYAIKKEDISDLGVVSEFVPLSDTTFQENEDWSSVIQVIFSSVGSEEFFQEYAEEKVPDGFGGYCMGDITYNSYQRGKKAYVALYSESGEKAYMRYKEGWEISEGELQPFEFYGPFYLLQNDDIVVQDYSASLQAGYPIFYYSSDYGSSFQKIQLKDVAFSDLEKETDISRLHQISGNIEEDDEGFSLVWCWHGIDEESVKLFTTKVAWDFSRYTLTSDVAMPD